MPIPYLTEQLEKLAKQGIQPVSDMASEAAEGFVVSFTFVATATGHVFQVACQEGEIWTLNHAAMQVSSAGATTSRRVISTQRKNLRSDVNPPGVTSSATTVTPAKSESAVASLVWTVWEPTKEVTLRPGDILNLQFADGTIGDTIVVRIDGATRRLFD